MADKIADLLTSMGIKFVYHADFPVAKIKVSNQDSQVRKASHIAPPKTVSQFANQMKAGAEFPPIVICAATDEMADGNTRLAAHKRNEQETIPAYVADFGSLIIRQYFAGKANQQGGLRLTPEEAKELALRLMEEGTHPTEIALGLGVSEDEAKKWAWEVECRKRLIHAGVDAVVVNSYRPSDLTRMNSIRLDSVLVEMAALIRDSRIPSREVSKSISGLNKVRSENDALAAIASWRKHFAAEIKKSKAGIGTKKPSAAACIALAYSNLTKRSLKEYVIELNGDASSTIRDQLLAMHDFTNGLLDALTKAD